MAKLSAKNRTELARVTTNDVRYRAMSDGVILRQWRYNGRWQTPTVFRTEANGRDAREWVKRYGTATGNAVEVFSE